MFSVERLARHGRVHPDAEVAKLAAEWAQAVLSAEPKYPVESSNVARFFRAALIEFATLGLWGDFHFQRALAERRAIKSAHLISQAADSAGET